MLDDFSVDKRGLHRRVSGGLKRLNKRWVFTPTAIFTPVPTATSTSSDSGTPFTGLFPPASSSVTTTNLLPTLTPTTTSSIPPTTSSTTSLPTTSSTIPTTSSTVPPTSTLAPTTSTPTTTLQQTPVQDATTEVDITVTPSHSTIGSATSLAASPTTSTTPKSGVSSGVLIGGIIAVVIAVAGIVFAVVYFIRRSRKASDEDDFNADAFRRQSMMLPDTDSVSGMSRATPWGRGGARPPTMIEQKLAHNPVSYVPPVPPNPYSFGAYNHSSFSPGQVYTPTTTNSANPFFSPYDDRSPIGTPAPPEAYDVQYNAVSRQTSMASSTVLSRHSSNTAKPLPDIVADDYVDMSRSSVTPFQAAQYADISRRLNTTPPQGLPLHEVDEEYEQAQEIAVPSQKNVEPLELQPGSLGLDAQHLSVQPTPREHAFPESPFADPDMAEQQRLSQRDSTGSILQPPEPIFDADAPSPKARIASIPPMLPELTLQERPFSPVTIDFPVAPSSVRPSPSPFSTTFTDIPSSPPKAHLPEPAAAPEPTLRAGASVPAAKRPDTVYTLYDDDDAYGGI